jgi:hypothetical protein
MLSGTWASIVIPEAPNWEGRAQSESNRSRYSQGEPVEARSQSAVTEAEAYLSEVETLAASSDRDSLKFEQQRTEQLASDACLPKRSTGARQGCFP